MAPKTGICYPIGSIDIGQHNNALLFALYKELLWLSSFYQQQLYEITTVFAIFGSTSTNSKIIILYATLMHRIVALLYKFKILCTIWHFNDYTNLWYNVIYLVQRNNKIKYVTIIIIFIPFPWEQAKECPLT